MSAAPIDKKKKKEALKGLVAQPRALMTLARTLREGVIKVDEKTQSKSPSFSLITEEGVTIKEQLRLMGVSRRPVRTRLAVSFSNGSGAGLALAFAQRIRPGDSAEFSSFAALYDEYKCHGTQVLYHMAASAIPANTDFVACYDPSSGLLTNIAEGLVAEQHTYFNTGSSNAGTITAWPLSVAKDGHFKQRIKIPSGVVTASGLVIDGGWVSTADSTADFGYWKGWATAGGGAIVVTVGGHFIMDVEFRMRS